MTLMAGAVTPVFVLEGGDTLFVDNAKGYIRLNLAMPRSIIAEGLKRIVKAIKER